MAFLRQYVAPLIAVIIFFVALAAVSARIFLPDDMAAPAPIEEVSSVNQHAQTPTLNVVGSGESIAIAN